MVIFNCKNITTGAQCKGHVRYTAMPVEMVSMATELEGSIDAIQKDKAIGVSYEVLRQASQILSKKGTYTRTKIIYLTCDAEEMHVEPYEIPAKK